MTKTESVPVRVRVAAIILQNDSLLLVRHEKDGADYWLLPGGGVKATEALTHALVRELREEANIEIAPKDLVLVNDTIAPDGSRHIIHLSFTADIVSGSPSRGGDPRVVEVAFVPLDELASLDLRPAFQNDLIAACHAGFPHAAAYLGNIWK